MLLFALNSSYYIYDTENPVSINETESKTDEELIENSKKSHIKIDMKWDHRCIRYDSVSSWSQALVMLHMLSKYLTPFAFGFMYVLGIIVDLLTEGVMFTQGNLETSLILASIPFSTYLLSWFIMQLPTHWWMRNSKGAEWELNRETGMVKVFDYKTEEYYETKKPSVFECPFYEFEPVIFQVPNRHGGLEESLVLRHRKKAYAVNFGCFTTSLREPEWVKFWHYIQNYMDISKPLPDTPQLESSRQYDPTTIAYDAKTGRNPRYWRDMSEEEYKRIKDKANTPGYIIADAYPCIIKARAKQGSLATA